MTNVYIRKKPLLEKDEEIVRVEDVNTITITKDYDAYDGRKKIKILKYNFDGIFNCNTNNEYIYDKIIKNNLNDNFTCFMYGQTGSGKTHTVLGTKNDDGIFVKIGQYLLSTNNEIFLSAYQIYNEELKDLLNKNNKLKLLETGDKNFVIPGLSFQTIKTKNDLDFCLDSIKLFRSDGANNVNFNSSRSHAVLIFKYIKNNKDIKIRIIDLAGNERSKNSNIHDFKSRQENKYINSSLFILKECIRRVGTRAIHVPFRGSKLTSVLRNCFTRKHKSIMIATICANKNNYFDIINTLNYSYKLNKFLSKPKQRDTLKKKKKILPPVKKYRNNISDLKINKKKNRNIRPNILERKISNIIKQTDIPNVIIDDNIKDELLIGSPVRRLENTDDLLKLIKKYKKTLLNQQQIIIGTVEIASGYIENHDKDTARDFLNLLIKRNTKNTENMLKNMRMIQEIRDFNS
jgi:hypothetical protein